MTVSQVHKSFNLFMKVINTNYLPKKIPKLDFKDPNSQP